MSDDLKAFLQKLLTGEVPNDKLPKLQRLLAAEWGNFRGSDYGGMQPYKLRDRMEGTR